MLGLISKKKYNKIIKEFNIVIETHKKIKSEELKISYSIIENLEKQNKGLQELIISIEAKEKELLDLLKIEREKLEQINLIDIEFSNEIHKSQLDEFGKELLLDQLKELSIDQVLNEVKKYIIITEESEYNTYSKIAKLTINNK